MNDLILRIMQIKKSRVFVFFAALLFFLPGSLLAADDEEERWGTRQPTFTELDKNLDGFISKDEAEAWSDLSVDNKFNQVDKNNDDKLDYSEFRVFQNKKIKESIHDFIKPTE
ncbi:conserved hypothetical protein [Nitrosococcus halophilus Nc 4]|uniref:EF-hand domain-containing protein n=1 Tax=Nitrosococcus halophilus (strain Nc4) TaxID=472759 RepID=D5C1X8_NITHN|nr:hypothetical protein [Nitrosococcus halophilus]ADE16566.1 conserved hypothetical protein [Nitrosococcus halophilus Nc 4]